jgi:hypothetical protein
MQCPSCGRVNPDGAVSCGFCHRRFRDVMGDRVDRDPWQRPKPFGGLRSHGLIVFFGFIAIVVIVGIILRSRGLL